MQAISEQAFFTASCDSFVKLLRTAGSELYCPKFAGYFEEQLVPIAEHWAAWGRKHLQHLRCDTNNLSEATNRMQKYGLGQRRVFGRWALPQTAGCCSILAQVDSSL